MRNSSPRPLSILASTGITYTLAGNSRAATVTIADDTGCTMTDTLRDIPQGSLKFNAGQTIHVKRARLVSSGAPGLRPSPDRPAATLAILQGTMTINGFEKTSDTKEVPLNFVNWNSWEEKDFDIEFVADNSVLGIKSTSVMNVDDFNVQEAFVGQSFNVMLELEADLYVGV